MKRLLLALIVVATLAGPSHADISAADVSRLTPFVPKGYTLSEVVPGFGADRVAIVVGGDSSRVFVLHRGKPIWLVTRSGKRDLPARVQGGAGEKIGQLVYTATLQKQPLLFVTCYMADAYMLLVFKPLNGSYAPVFEISSINTPKLDRDTGRLKVEQYTDGGDEATPVTCTWRGGTFVKDAPARPRH